MRLYHLVFSLCLFIGVLPLSAQSSRSGEWRVERLLGSSQLSLESIRTLVVPAQPGAALLAAVEDFREVFALRYGVDLEIVTATESRPKSAIYLGDSGRVRCRAGDGSFSIHREGARVYVAADGERGLLNGVYALCSELLGARWYWAGDLGFELVGSARATFPEGLWREEPAFVQRTFYPVDGDFGRRNRLVRLYSFNHALAKVFSAELYEREPEVFSEVYGRRREPKGSAGMDAQPDFSEPRAVELAAEAALAAFEKNPEARSFSLSINDNVLFDDSEATQQLVEPVNYFRTRPNYTDLVFGFMNAVAERVFEEGGAWTTPSGQPRYLTALAYYWTEQSPSFQIHPRVMPVLTSDRAQWHDPEYRAGDKALIKRWADSGAERIATWDYYFGSPYIYPRQFNEWIAESLAFMSQNGVTVFFSQLPSSWGLDGGKAWLASELLWNPEQDADVLLDEYYTNFFGAAAAPIRGFYERAESHRNANEGTADWIKFYKDESGIELFDTEILLELRGLIESAKALVEDDARRLARVEVVSEAFSLTEAFAQSHAASSELVANSLAVLSESEGGAAASLPAQLIDFMSARTAFNQLSELLLKNPMHARLKHFTNFAKLDPVALSLAAMAHGGVSIPEADLPDYTGEVQIAQWWADSDDVFHSKSSNVELRHAAGESKPRNFLGPNLPKVKDWVLDFRPSEFLSVGAVDGDSGIRVTGADMFSIFRDVPVISEQRYLLDASLAYRISPDNRTHVSLSWSDRDGRSLGKEMLFRCPTGESNGTQRIVLPIRAPSQAYTLRVRFVVSRQYEGDYLDLERVNFGLIAK
ncbi:MULTISPECIES: DUF4838 domain-containing protein [unclassified Lentimonas]|uniref:DUF4838 domain-containing protein n=1 Tax=unclassified Lentimonas TaxID=2630993 RepID=UPI0013283EB7|nr:MULTISPECIES: DUF4838 domain-containing protein [unclassified Lentimonas]CAA6691985.1 Unannotated [Lentimonas sp. CC10]CAA6694064.1 Unannotated [Lentimonas sp. CC19]CAA7070308.1 Unannotated [Lentimonas sp. CC11]